MIKRVNVKDKINASRLNISALIRKVKIARSLQESAISHLRPDIQCTRKWYGNSYGGFFVNPKLLDQSSVVYSVGIGKDVSFDLALFRKHGCNIYAFDPTPVSVQWVSRQNLPPQFKFQAIGLGVKSGPATFFLTANPKSISGSALPWFEDRREIEVQMKTLSDIAHELGHQRIHLLKMDVEGAEYEILENILKSGIIVDQLIVEFHDRMFDTRTPKSKDIVNRLREHGYGVFAASSSFEEISFIRKELV